MLDYLNFEQLRNNYAVSWTDSQHGMLEITYDGGKTKTIRDYGMSGTYGLKQIYNLIGKLRFNQKWKEKEKPQNKHINYADLM